MHKDITIESRFTEEQLNASKKEWLLQDMTFVLFGATGDLAQRKLFPALYNLFIDDKLPDRMSIVGLGRKDSSHEAFQSKVEQALQENSRRPVDAARLPEFLDMFRYCTFDAEQSTSYDGLKSHIEQREQELGIPQNRLFYLSVAPHLIETITAGLHASGTDKLSGWKRLIVEKPFGSSLETARLLNRKLSAVFREEEIYRIDHYLGKPMVQNLNTLMAANPFFESAVSRKQISNIQITASETVGIENRSNYYEQAGAIRDMVQNHLLQLVMVSATLLPNKLMNHDQSVLKTDIMKSLRPITKDQAHHQIVRAQYDRGTVNDVSVNGYTEEAGVQEGSTTDTYVAARLSIDHPSWEGIPFYIRTGKRINQKSTQIVIEFEQNELASQTFQGVSPNLMVLEISPLERVAMRINVKDATSGRFKPVWTDFSTSSDNQPEAYELLLHDALRGNSSFFADWPEVELSWEWVQPIVAAFDEQLLPLHHYPAGSKGPDQADQLLLEQGHNWW